MRNPSHATREFWLSHHGAIVTIDGHFYRLSVACYNAVYPYPHVSLTIGAEMVDKQCDKYRETRRKLGDDWCVGLTDNPELLFEVEQQLLPSKQPALSYVEVI